MDINEIVSMQKSYFAQGNTTSLSFRLDSLRKLRFMIRKYKDDIDGALKIDLGRASFENYMVETGFVLAELDNAIKKLPRWMKDKRKMMPLEVFPAKGFIRSEPFGSCLIMAPWNYPFQLSIVPLIGAIAAGNCAVVKPSAYAPETSRVIAAIVAACFEPEYVSVVEGGREANSQLLNEKFDFIFFTGSKDVGKVVMNKASENLVPVCLELGGKSPVIVDPTAKISVAARRIVFGKFLNAGQTCVAPDYLFVHENVKDELVAEMIKYIEAFFGDDPLTCPDYPKIINKKHFDRLKGLLEGEDVIYGGSNDGDLHISPTLLDNVDLDSPIMQEEIFGPILPILTYDDIYTPIEYIKNHDKPLSLYLFTGYSAVEKIVLRECSFGGGCINDTIMHLSTNKLPFGGVGASGMGNYHGEYSFRTFSHQKSILKRGTWPDVPLRYHPYTDMKKRILEWYWK